MPTATSPKTTLATHLSYIKEAEVALSTLGSEIERNPKEGSTALLFAYKAVMSILSIFREHVEKYHSTDHSEVDKSLSLIGKRVRLEACSDPYTGLRKGAMGTVESIDATGTVFVMWDAGHSLGLVQEAGDRFTVIGQ